MKYRIITYGCQMNHSDSERIARVLEKIGYRPVHKNEEADLIVVNACSVRQSAVDRIYGQSKYLNELKTNNRKLITVLTGCILEEDREKLAQIFDVITNISEIDKLSYILNLKRHRNREVQNLKDFKNFDFANWNSIRNSQSYLDIKPKYQSQICAYVPIMTGCNNYCSYCVVPYVRGPEISRPAQAIIEEIRSLVKKGYKKITLLGQNVNSYRAKLKAQNSKSKEINFIELIKLINSIPGDFWFSFITNHPKDMSDQLINTLPALDKLCPYIHLPVQSADNQILKKMNRHYTRDQYLSLVKKLRKALPNLNLSTDIIVGFPGETKKQFEETKKLMEEVKFDMAYIARYSPRPQTAAYKMVDNVPAAEKKRREKILTEILKKTALENNQRYRGKTVEVLIEKEIRILDSPWKIYLGETKTLKHVKIKSSQKLLGKTVAVKIKDANPWGLAGELN